MKTRKEFEQYFKANIEPSINNDLPALRQAWNDTIDALCKEGTLPDRARDWRHPRRFYRYGTVENPHRDRPRKTKDEYEIQGDYGHGHGWEKVTTEETWRAAKDQLRTYRENEPGVPFKIVTKRVPVVQPVKELSAN